MKEDAIDPELEPMLRAAQFLIGEIIRYEGSEESEERIATAGTRVHRELLEWILNHALTQARNESSKAPLYVVPRVPAQSRARATPH